MEQFEVLILDDDKSVRDSLAWLFKSRGVSTNLFANPADLIMYLGLPSGEWSPRTPSCLVLDIRMPEMNGIALFEQLKSHKLQTLLPVIFLTGHGDVETAVAAIKNGAFDFFEKPFSTNTLVDRALDAVKCSATAHDAQKFKLLLTKRLNDLTLREREIMWLIADGLPNKIIASNLDISIRTVEIHRSRIYKKLEATSGIGVSNLLATHSIKSELFEPTKVI